MPENETVGDGSCCFVGIDTDAKNGIKIANGLGRG